MLPKFVRLGCSWISERYVALSRIVTPGRTGLYFSGFLVYQGIQFASRSPAHYLILQLNLTYFCHRSLDHESLNLILEASDLVHKITGFVGGNAGLK